MLLHLVSLVDKSLPVYFLETGKHFPETLRYVETLRVHLGLTNIRWLRPDPKDIARFDPRGELWETDPDSCCHIRKTEPLDAEIAQYAGWVTGRKRYQTAERGVLPHFELTSDDRIKVNPLAYFNDADVNAYKQEHGLPEHPLFARAYRSAVPVHGDRRRERIRAPPLAQPQRKSAASASTSMSDRKAGGRGGKEPFKAGAFMADPFHLGRRGHLASVRYNAFPAVSSPTARRCSPIRIPIAAVRADRSRTWRWAGGSPGGIASGATDGRHSSARLVVEPKGERCGPGDADGPVPLMHRCGINASW